MPANTICAGRSLFSSTLVARWVSRVSSWMRLYPARRRANPKVERVLVEAVLGGLDVPARLVASEPVGDAAHADVLHEVGSQRVAHLPQLRVRDVVHAAPGVRVGGARLPSRPEVAIEQLAHPRCHPGRHVHAVGDVPDRDRVGGSFGEERLPHLASDLAVATAHAIARAAHLDTERGHDELLVGIVGPGAAEVEEALEVEPGLLRVVTEDLDDLADVVSLVAGAHRRMSREDGAITRGGEGLVPRAAERHLAAGHLERRERGVPLVEVDDARVHPHRVEDAHRADPEECVLGEPGRPVGDVETAGDPLIDRGVLGTLRVEEVERRAADVEAPHLDHDVAPAQRHGHGQRLATVIDKSGGNSLGVDLEPVLDLVPRPVHALLEIALTVEETDADHRQRHVGRLLEDVPGEHAEAARIDRQRPVHRELGAEKRHRAAPVWPSRPWTDAPARGRASRMSSVKPVQQGDISGGALEGRGRRLVEQANRIVVARLPAHRVDHPKDVVAARPPRPSVVVGEARERLEWGRQPSREIRGSAVDVLAAVGKGGGCELGHCAAGLGQRLLQRGRRRSAAHPCAGRPRCRRRARRRRRRHTPSRWSRRHHRRPRPRCPGPDVAPHDGCARPCAACAVSVTVRRTRDRWS